VSAPVAVIGAGVKTPAGNTVDDVWRFLLAARTSAQLFHDERLPADVPVLACRVPPFDVDRYLSRPESRRADYASVLAIAAADDAMDAVVERPPPHRCAVVCGTGFGSTATIEAQMSRFAQQGLRAVSPLAIPVMMPNNAASLLSMRFGFKGPCHTLSTACASGASAIGEAMELLRRNGADLVLAGGVDSMVTASGIAGFLRLDAMSRYVEDPSLASRPFDRDRDGFVMSEGAGFVVLERHEDALRRDRDILGVAVGYGACADAHHLVAPSPEGDGALRCMQLALADASVARRDVNHVNAHGTSTVANDLAEAFALVELFGSHSPPVTAVKGATGHMIAASGAVEAIVTLRSLREGLVPPTAGVRNVDPEVKLDVVVGQPRRIGAGYGITNAFGFGGSNAVLVLSA
jgi:3-oxoacyl-[acyl-carrier-protein] synthase II